MLSRKIILLSLALAVGVATALVFRSGTAPQEPGSTATTVEATQVLAAARDLPTGTILKEGDMKWIAWGAETEGSKLYIKGKDDMNSLAGAVLREGLRQDEPLLTGQVVQPHDHGFLSAVLTPGKRAMSIALTPSAGVAGFIFPGDHVDVILTHSFSRKDVSDLTERRVSETVVSDARVLALDQKSDNQSTDVKVAQLATIEVTQKQAEKLALATDIVGQATSGRGSISLVLRSLAVDEPSLVAETRNPTWDSDVSPAYPTVNGEDGLMQKVQVMRGKEISESTFERHR